ncbi:MAG TPA: S1 RNA-binding domain-containing protein, partial [Solirubrobacterales bacterium]|nr:S1 RNA-binding domain-containing protein [Solirubrobacterales bacterium]
DRQRISLGLKQTQEDPWQRVVSTYRSGDVLEGTVTKVVSFGAFVEILDGVEGLVHISELADHHVENPSEVVELGASLNVKILEIDEERRRLSLSIKRVEGQNMLLKERGAALAAASGEPAVEEETPELGLSEEVFADDAEAPADSAEEVAPEVEAVVDEAIAEAEVADAAEQAEAADETPEEVVEDAVAEAEIEAAADEAAAEEAVVEEAGEITEEAAAEEAAEGEAPEGEEQS